MTRRELCERLMNIQNSVMIASGGTGDIGGDPCYGIGNAIRDLILDLVSPVEKKNKRIWPWWECPFRKNCKKEDCRCCSHRPKDTIPVCDVEEPEEKKSSLSSAPVIKVDGMAPVVECPICHNLTHLLYDAKKYYCPKCDFLFGALEK